MAFLPLLETRSVDRRRSRLARANDRLHFLRRSQKRARKTVVECQLPVAHFLFFSLHALLSSLLVV
jgi:hypothetical protein